MTLLSNLPSQVAGLAVDVFRLCLWLVLLVAIFVPLERLFARRPSKFLRSQIGNDLAYYFYNRLMPAALMTLPLAVLATLVQKLLPAGFHDSMDRLPLWIGISAGLIVGDIGSYWAIGLVMKSRSCGGSTRFTTAPNIPTFWSAAAPIRSTWW